jgi:hypothetical protein
MDDDQAEVISHRGKAGTAYGSLDVIPTRYIARSSFWLAEDAYLASAAA